MKNNTAKKVAVCGMFICLSMIMGYIESLIPIPMPFPGMKIGLANIVIVWVLYATDLKTSVLVSALRVVLTGFMFGNLFSILFGLAGAFLSLTVMFLLKKIKKFSMIGVSMAGGVGHNLGQITVAALVLENVNVMYYFPALLLSGVLSGIFVGIAGGIIFSKIKSLQTHVQV